MLKRFLSLLPGWRLPFRWLELKGKVRSFEEILDHLQEQLIGIACQPLTGADLLQEKLISSVSAFDR